MTVTVKRTGLPLDQALAQILTVDDWRAIGELARLTIVERTRRGSAPEGVSWPGYSEGYADRKYQALGAAPVNLTVSGEMLGGLQVIDVDARHVTLGWLR